MFSRLNTQPARSSVNASTPSFRVAPHDSRPLLFATLSTFETFTHTTLPVLPAHRNLMKIVSTQCREVAREQPYEEIFCRNPTPRSCLALVAPTSRTNSEKARFQAASSDISRPPGRSRGYAARNSHII